MMEKKCYYFNAVQMEWVTKNCLEFSHTNDRYHLSLSLLIIIISMSLPFACIYFNNSYFTSRVDGRVFVRVCECGWHFERVHKDIRLISDSLQRDSSSLFIYIVYNIHISVLACRMLT